MNMYIYTTLLCENSFQIIIKYIKNTDLKFKLMYHHLSVLCKLGEFIVWSLKRQAVPYGLSKLPPPHYQKPKTLYPTLYYQTAKRGFPQMTPSNIVYIIGLYQERSQAEAEEAVTGGKWIKPRVLWVCSCSQGFVSDSAFCLLCLGSLAMALYTCT